MNYSHSDSKGEQCLNYGLINNNLTYHLKEIYTQNWKAITIESYIFS